MSEIARKLILVETITKKKKKILLRKIILSISRQTTEMQPQLKTPERCPLSRVRRHTVRIQGDAYRRL